MKSEVVYCWNCKTAMTIEGDYYKCSECGATWNELSQGVEYTGIERQRGATGGGLKFSPVRKRA